jgi:hypothetical protein
MKKLGENLSKLLDIEDVQSKDNLPQVVQKNDIVVSDEIESDAQFARENIKDLIEKGNDAFTDLLKVAKESEHPRAYEVAAGFFKNLADLNKDLLELQKRKRDLKPELKNETQNINVDKAVFVGSTTDLVKFIKENK